MYSDNSWWGDRDYRSVTSVTVLFLSMKRKDSAQTGKSVEDLYSQEICKNNWQLEVAWCLTESVQSLRWVLAPSTGSIRLEKHHFHPNSFCLARNCLPCLLIIWDKVTRELLHLSFQGQSVNPHSFGKCRGKTSSIATLKKITCHLKEASYAFSALWAV